MKKVMHLMSTHAFSGAENVACQIINMFDKSNEYEMIYVSEIKENKEMLDSRKIKYIKLNKFSYRNVKNAVNEIQPDIIHAHDIKASIIASMFHNKCKIVAHIHANHENMRKRNLKTIMLNNASKNIDNFIWVSKSALENYKYSDNIKDKSIILYNVVNCEEIKKKISEDKNNYNFDLIYLGRLNYQKNPEKLINVINLVKEKKKDIKVAIVGNGDYEDLIKQKIKSLGLSNNVEMYGFIKNPYKILESSKIMIMTSRYEGTPMCALEAISLGKPIISTPTDGLCELVENDINGYLSEDDKEIANKIVEILADDKKYKIFEENTLIKNIKINNILDYEYKMKRIYG